MSSYDNHPYPWHLHGPSHSNSTPALTSFFLTQNLPPNHSHIIIYRTRHPLLTAFPAPCFCDQTSGQDTTTGGTTFPGDEQVPKDQTGATTDSKKKDESKDSSFKDESAKDQKPEETEASTTTAYSKKKYQSG
ncbi:hypothetical protein QR685DRAFT_569620 [Neurospora intermedia]|uniref:Uncharacterized protein n=1 Tax=Neurospora intermedia TaxID=5142 RepID=A0ABR3DMK1_NEUIN